MTSAVIANSIILATGLFVRNSEEACLQSSFKYYWSTRLVLLAVSGLRRNRGLHSSRRLIRDVKFDPSH